MRNLCKPFWGIFLAALIVGPVYGFKPFPPPETLDITVRNATLIFVGSGVELLSIDSAGKLISHSGNPLSPDVSPYYLRTRVERILYCESPCPSRSEVVLVLSSSLVAAPDRRIPFVGVSRIYLVIDRTFARVPAHFKDSWFAQPNTEIGFYRTLEFEPAVNDAIKNFKTR